MLSITNSLKESIEPKIFGSEFKLFPSIYKLVNELQREYKLNPILAIQFIFKGKVLPDNLKFGGIGIHPQKDVITVMATQAGGFDVMKDFSFLFF